MNVDEIRRKLNKVENALIVKTDRDCVILEFIVVNDYQVINKPNNFDTILVGSSIWAYIGTGTKKEIEAQKNINNSLKTQIPFEDNWDYLFAYRRYIRVYPNGDELIMVVKKDPFLNPL